MFIKPLLHVKHVCSMQSVKQQDNLRNFSNATSITSGGLDKTLAVPVIIFVGPMMVMSDRNTIKFSLASRSKTIHFKTKKYEVFHSLQWLFTVEAVIEKCHTLMGVDSTV